MFLSAACLAVWGPAGNPSDRPLRSASHLPNTPTENTGCHEKRRSTNLGKFKPLVFESWTSDQASSAAYVSASLAATSKKPAVSSLLLRHLSMHVLYWFTLLSSNLSLLSASSLLCFSSVHIVGSLTSKLPSTIWNRLFSAFLGGLIRNITWNHPRPTPKSRCFPSGTTRGGSCEGQCILRAASRRSEYTASEHVDNRTPILPSTWCFCRRLVLQSEALQAIPAIALFGRPVIFRTHLQKTRAAMRKDVQPTLGKFKPLVFESWTSDQASSAAYVSASLAATSKKPAVSSLLFRHLSMHVLYWFTLLSSDLSLLSASSLLSFSSVHIVGSLASKLPSIIIV